MSETISAKEYQDQYNSRQKPGKYKAVRVMVDGFKFDSKKEAEYYGVLKLKMKAGEIKSFRRQVRYKIEINGEKICTYVADFVEKNHDGSERIIDVKSEFTKTMALYRLKKRLMEVLYRIKIIEV